MNLRFAEPNREPPVLLILLMPQTVTQLLQWNRELSAAGRRIIFRQHGDIKFGDFVTPRLHIFEDCSVVARRVADLFMQLDLNKEGQQPVFVALAGGSTPEESYRRVAKRPMNWSRFHFFWSDERCVPADDEQSNFRMAGNALLNHITVNECQIHRIHGEADPPEECRRYAKEVVQTLDAPDQQIPVFDMVLLGVGADGHTASIFPGGSLHREPAGICAWTEHPQSGQKRITLTMEVINAARNVVLVACGDHKAGVIADWLGRKKTGKLPVADICPVQGSFDLYLDSLAASELNDIHL